MLVSQSAMAIHVDKLDGGASQHSYTQSPAPVDQHDEVSGACNHYCHASAHLVGLFSDSTLELHTSRDNHVATLKNILDSFNDQPSIPPPIS